MRARWFFWPDGVATPRPQTRIRTTRRCNATPIGSRATNARRYPFWQLALSLRASSPSLDEPQRTAHLICLQIDYLVVVVAAAAAAVVALHLCAPEIGSPIFHSSRFIPADDRCQLVAPEFVRSPSRSSEKWKSRPTGRVSPNLIPKSGFRILADSLVGSLSRSLGATPIWRTRPLQFPLGLATLVVVVAAAAASAAAATASAARRQQRRQQRQAGRLLCASEGTNERTRRSRGRPNKVSPVERLSATQNHPNVY